MIIFIFLFLNISIYNCQWCMLFPWHLLWQRNWFVTIIFESVRSSFTTLSFRSASVWPFAVRFIAWSDFRYRRQRQKRIRESDKQKKKKKKSYFLINILGLFSDTLRRAQFTLFSSDELNFCFYSISFVMGFMTYLWWFFIWKICNWNIFTIFLFVFICFLFCVSLYDWWIWFSFIQIYFSFFEISKYSFESFWLFI